MRRVPITVTVADWEIPSGKYFREIIMPGIIIPLPHLTDRFALIVPHLKVLLIQAPRAVVVVVEAAVGAAVAEAG